MSFIDRFVENADQTSSPAVRKRYGTLASITGLMVNMSLSAMKIAVGLFSGALSITADGVNNLSDAASSLVSLVSFYITSKPPDKEHPFGHARAEYLFSSVVALVILYIGITLFRNSIDKILNPTEIDFSLVIVFVLLASILAKLWLYRFYKGVGDKIDSEMLRATALDSVSDVMATSAVLVATLLFRFFQWNLDGYMGLFVSALILKSGIEILLSTMNRLLGDAPTKKDIEVLRDFITSYDGVLGIHDLIVHDYGPGHKFVTVHVEVNAKDDVIMSHETIDQIERDAEEKLGIALTIHMDPLIVDDPRTNEIKEDVLQAVLKVSPNYSIHDFRIIDSFEATNIVFDVLVPVDDKQSDVNIEEQIRKEIESLHKSYVPKITIDRDLTEQGSLLEATSEVPTTPTHTSSSSNRDAE